MNKAKIASLAILSAAIPGLQARAEDPRLRVEHWSDGEVFELNGAIGIQSVVVFERDEQIENIALGDSTCWQVTPNERGNLLFAKPIAADSETNMTVVTNKRIYYLELSGDGKSGPPTFSLNFTYSAPPAEPEVQDAPEAEEGPAADPPSPPVPAPPEISIGEMNFEWKKKGSSRLFPDRVFSSADETFLLWENESDIPAILLETGETAPAAAFSMRDGYVVIAGVPDEINLRKGRRSARLINRHPDVTAAVPDADHALGDGA